jgi:hypothetical protein
MLLLVAAYCGWILSLPLFPMQDGPVHLYLAQVLGDVVAHKPSVYAGFYSVPRLLTPYSSRSPNSPPPSPRRSFL